jgi:hypothetical protein
MNISGNKESTCRRTSQVAAGNRIKMPFCNVDVPASTVTRSTVAPGR